MLVVSFKKPISLDSNSAILRNLNHYLRCREQNKTIHKISGSTGLICQEKKLYLIFSIVYDLPHELLNDESQKFTSGE